MHVHYIVRDPVSGEALIIDPVIGCHSDVEALEGMCVSELQWIANTLIHATTSLAPRAFGHILGTAARTVVSKASGGVADRLV